MNSEWVIEFRNGTLFQDLEADHGGPIETAQRFESEALARTFMNANPWIAFNGGMPIPVSLTRDERSDRRG
jgi:hypothetical protein